MISRAGALQICIIPNMGSAVKDSRAWGNSRESDWPRAALFGVPSLHVMPAERARVDKASSAFFTASYSGSLSRISCTRV
jgi:hypothetical protein